MKRTSNLLASHGNHVLHRLLSPAVFVIEEAVVLLRKTMHETKHVAYMGRDDTVYVNP